MFDSFQDGQNDDERKFVNAAHNLEPKTALRLPSKVQREALHEELAAAGKLEYEKFVIEPLGSHFFGQFLALAHPTSNDRSMASKESHYYLRFLKKAQKFSKVRDGMRRKRLGGMIAKAYLGDLKCIDQGEKDRITAGLGGAAAPPADLYAGASAAVTAKVKSEFPRFLETPLFTMEYLEYKWASNQTVNLDDFELMMKLGQGALGIVEGAKRLETGKCFALKRQDKRLIKKKGATRMCIAERDVLAEVQSRFVVRVHYAFQNRSYIFLALDLMTGGTLEYNVQQQDDGKFSEAASAFYGAEVACGLRALHCNDVIYRDLKSENVLLNDKGHAMLSDMGIATKKRPGKPMNQKIGTPGWWAPEVCKGETYGRRSDWFSFGCLMYEMLVGHNPFLRKAHQSNKHPDAMTVEWDPMGADGGWEDLGLSDDAVGLLKGLLQKNPANRLHYDKIRDHPFFAHIEWDLMETGDWDEPPPIIPNAGEACVDQEENIMQRQSVGRLSFVQLSSNEFDKFDFHNKATVQEELVTLHMSGLQIRPEGSQVAKSSACNVQ